MNYLILSNEKIAEMKKNIKILYAIKLKNIYYLINEKIYLLNKKKINIILFNIFKLKPNLIFLSKNKCKLNLTTGIILKKLKLKEKSLKKDMRVINYMIKIFFFNLDFFYKNYNFIINIIGLNKNYFRIIKFFKKNTLLNKNIFIMNLNKNINIKKYKKKKSIKKKFVKKNIKIN